MPKIRAENISAHKAQTRAAILEAAYVLVTGDDCGALRRDEVAALASVARTTVYSYFATNEELIQALAEERAEAILAAVLDRPELPADDEVAAILALVERCLAYAAANVRDATLFVRVARTVPPALSERMWRPLLGVFGEIDRLVGIGVERGTIPAEDRAGLVLGIGELLMGGVDQLLRAPDPTRALGEITCSRLSVIRRLVET